MSRVALITGITGQDGSYLATLLLRRGYEVHALRQPSALPDLKNIETILSHITLHYGDMTDGTSIAKIIRDIRPDEIYNLAAQSHVQVSFDVPEYTAQVNGIGVLRLLEAIRTIDPRIKLFQASTSELFGDSPAPQNEQTLMNPRSPYAAAKKYAYDMVRIYREAYGLFACNGIMFNHESANRGEDFVTRKIAIAVAGHMAGKRGCLHLGNLEARRDWSHAEDIMEAAWLMMQHRVPDDFILASGISYSVRDFANKAFAVAGIRLKWLGQGLAEIATDAKTGKTLIAIDPELFRPLEVENLRGDAAKAKDLLGWSTRKNFETIVHEMVEAELGTRDIAQSNRNYASVV